MTTSRTFRRGRRVLRCGRWCGWRWIGRDGLVERIIAHRSTRYSPLGTETRRKATSKGKPEGIRGCGEHGRFTVSLQAKANSPQMKIDRRESGFLCLSMAK